MVNAFLKKVAINSAFIFLSVVILAALFWDGRVIVSLIFGGILGLMNLRWISKTMRGILEDRKPAKPKRALLFSNILKLVVLTLILIIVLKAGAINPLAFLIGFTLIIAVILFEGMIFAKRLD